MGGNHVVVDISSDEDVGLNWPATDVCDSDIDWTELFVNLESDAGENQNGYDSDEVVVVREVLAKPKRTKKSSGVANLGAQHREEDDDDCVILDGDPDKPEAEEKDSGYESDDDLVIVAEKGQVACRDYPHPRHLCVKFPFGSTLHSEHCNLCHCYVCDSPAPCNNWGNGISVTDHCHATEKEELWKSERKRTKQGETAPVVSSADTSFWKDLLYPIPAPALPVAQNGYLPGQAPSYDPPNIIRNQRISGLSGRSRYCSNPTSQQPLNPCSNSLQRAGVSSLSPHSVTSSPTFKRPRPIGKAGATVRDICLASKQAKHNSSLNDFRHGHTNHLMGNRDGVVKSDPRQNSSRVNTSQISAGPTPSQGQETQAQLYGQPTAHANGNPNENISAPVTSNAHCNTSQQSQCFTGVSDLQGGERLPLTEEHSWNGVNPDLRNWEGLDNPVLNELSVLDAEDGIYADCLWTQF